MWQRMRFVHGGLALLFLFSAGLQLNDPDPLPWVSLYVAAAALSAVAAAGRRPRWRRPAAIALALGALVWALAIAIRQDQLPTLSSLFGAWEMRSAAIEERRETLGLLLVSLWAAVIGLPGAGRIACPGPSIPNRRRRDRGEPAAASGPSPARPPQHQSAANAPGEER